MSVCVLVSLIKVTAVDVVLVICLDENNYTATLPLPFKFIRTHMQAMGVVQDVVYFA